MDFADAITIVVACPLFIAMTYCHMRAAQMSVATPLIGVHHRIGLGETMYVRLKVGLNTEALRERVGYAGSSTCDLRIQPFSVSGLLAIGTPEECAGSDDGRWGIGVIFQ